MFTILVEPIAEKDILITMLKRPIENAIKKKYKQRKGCMAEPYKDKNVH